MSTDSKLDMERVSMLISLVKGLTEGAGFGLSNILSEANAELREIDNNIRKIRQEKQGLPVTPASVGDPESPAQPIPPGGSEGDFDRHPTASAPIESVKSPPVPEVTQPAPTSEAGLKQAEDHPEIVSPAPAPSTDELDPSGESNKLGPQPHDAPAVVVPASTEPAHDVLEDKPTEVVPTDTLARRI